MDALKKFLNKKKADTKFKQAGPGHKLSETTGTSTSGATQKGKPQSNLQKQPHKSVSTPTDEKKQAAAAALARLEKDKSKRSDVNPQELLASRQLAFIKEQARKEIESEMRLKELNNSESEKTGTGSRDHDEFLEEYPLASNQRVIDPNSYIVSAVYFTCPIIGPDVLSKVEIEAKIKEFLLEQPAEELGVTSCLLIYSCNKGREKVETCVETLCKYLDNIVRNPSDMKFRKIRCANKVYQERVASIEGTREFLLAAGFTKTFEASDAGEEEFWVFSTDKAEDEFVPFLIDLRDTLKQTTPIRPVVDRNMQVLMPAQVKQRKELPPDFYELSPEELRMEQRLKTQLVEMETTLRTKAQRERDQLREQRIYRYCVIRIRFPDGFTLQGTFSSYDKVSEIYNFVTENMTVDTVDFALVKSGGDSLDNAEATLAECRLPPATIINFNAHSAPPSLATGEVSYLKPETLALVQSME